MAHLPVSPTAPTAPVAFGPITSWKMDGETIQILTDFIFLGSRITAEGDCSLKLRHLLFGRKDMTHLNSI